MHVRDVSFKSPVQNILYDDVLLHFAKEGSEDYLRFWESPVPFIVLGLTSRADEDLKWEEIRKDGLDVLRRSSGGGTVVQGPGCLNFTLILNLNRHPTCKDLRMSYQSILDRVCRSLWECGVKAAFFPISDLAEAESRKKFSGNAQKRTKNVIMHHGTILYAFDLRLIEKYLRIPRSIPEYREQRAHLDFVTNVSVDPAQFKQNIMSEYVNECNIEDMTDYEESFLNNLVCSRDITVLN